MLAKLFLMTLAALPLGTAVQANVPTPLRTYWGRNAPQPPTVRALIEHDQEGVILEVNGKYKIIDPNKGMTISTRYTGKVKFIEAIPDGLKWGEEFPGVHQIALVPASPSTSILVNGKAYKGVITIYDIGGTVSVVNEVPVEDYLASLLADKYSKSLPDETLAALVIVERTNAYYLSQNPKSNFWAADEAGYKGHVELDPQDSLLKAIKHTRHMVLSQAGAYPGEVQLFPVSWEPLTKKNAGMNPRMIASAITISEAEEIAKKGGHAANILEKAYPRTSIQLIQFAD